MISGRGICTAVLVAATVASALLSTAQPAFADTSPSTENAIRKCEQYGGEVTYADCGKSVLKIKNLPAGKRCCLWIA
ncbi:phosphosulfolactate phosphohydrolase-like enzyme [Nocardia goodfellowii]|uniref:Phosphosulfolactate phosphohydrolase-like enzyme n=1 Tax=Nocardia goodfellowii TaxID=882446 RepID=A0ABS4QKT2_9NOCA|nr:phosphosulfolactate phosphohydrolase-like enzyme [Nocardia goodfellowii]